MSFHSSRIHRGAFALAVLAAIHTPARAQTGTLRGTVTDSATGEPLAGARISLLGKTALPGTFTDEHGRFRVGAPSQGQLTVTVARIGYAPARRALAPGRGAETVIDFSLAAVGLPLDPVVVTVSRGDGLAFEAPASVSVVGRTRMDERPALVGIEQARATPGMDMASKGLIQRTYAVRGERGSISGALLTLTDYRYAEIPSLALNVPYLVAATDDDLDRIEVVRGPGAALYGPGADRGVVQILTRSPFESRGLSLTLTGGSRSMRGASARWARVLNSHLAFKISGEYLRGHDWQYRDTNEVAPRDSILERAGGEARLDWRPSAGTQVVASAGLADAIRVVDLAGDVGAVQGRHWQYRYAQTRVTSGQLFANVFFNMSNTGDSYLLNTGQTIVDSSRALIAQVQHGHTFGRADLRYGADVRWTDPRTGGTINGANESDDRMTEIGAYVHGTASLGARTELTAALRVDHHSRLEDVVVSPRVGVVWRPSLRHAFRLTFNRAFTSPNAVSLFSDVVQDSLGPYALRASYIPRSGYTFDRSCGGPCMHTPFGNPSTALPTDVTLLWQVAQLLAADSGVDLSGVPQPSAAQVATVLAAVNPDRLNPGLIPVTASDVVDVAPLRRTITNALEVGWKGLLGTRVALSADLYASRVHDQTGSLYVATPNAFYDPATLGAYLANYVSPSDAAKATAAIASVPMGTISPNETTHPTDLLILTRQGGTYTLVGVDVGAEAPLTRWLDGRAGLSWLNRDSMAVAGLGSDLVLSVPRHKAYLGASIHDAAGTHRIGLEARWVDAFPVHTGVYVGRVSTYTVLDARAGLAVPFMPRTSALVEVSNLLDHRHQEFVGAPAIGRLLVVRLRTTL